jgi:hypothetical protein
MVKGKRVQNTFVSPPHNDNYICDEEGQTIFYASYPKSLLDDDYVERYDISPRSSPN